ncbi:MAG: TetR/AcrR family transcriptional regulator C-terminal domain-containing protein [Candidatus Faecivicinus sp.]
MSQHTKRAILSAFLELLDAKSFDRISVVDIAQKSRINRNTFYYYYPDIFALVDDLLRESSRELLEKKPTGTTWNEILLEVTAFARAHQSAVYHLFQSQNRDRIERYLYDIILIGTEALIESEAKSLDVSERDLHVLCVYYASASLGLLIRWFLGGMRENAEEYLADISRLLEGSTHTLLRERKWKDALF